MGSEETIRKRTALVPSQLPNLAGNLEQKREGMEEGERGEQMEDDEGGQCNGEVEMEDSSWSNEEQIVEGIAMEGASEEVVVKMEPEHVQMVMEMKTEPEENMEVVEEELIANGHKVDYEDPIAKIIASLPQRPPPSDYGDVPVSHNPQNPAEPESENPEYPELVTIDPDTKEVTPFPTLPKRGDPRCIKDGSPPPKLFFRVKGEVVMPMFSIAFLRILAEEQRKKAPLSSSSEEEDDESQDEEDLLSFEEDRTPDVDTSTSTSPKSNLHSCPHCGIVFRHKNYLTNHLKSHQNKMEVEEPIYNCSFCQKEYFVKSSLVRHQIDQHSTQDENTIQCPFCTYLGDSQEPDKGLYSHVYEHLFPSPKKSPVRQKSPSSKRSSKTTTKPSRRKPKAISKKLNPTITSYNNNIAKLMPYSCTECGSRFRKKSFLATHLRYHHNKSKKREKPKGPALICRFCGNTYYERQSIVRHIISNHVTKENSKSKSDLCPWLCGFQGDNSYKGLYSHIVQHLISGPEQVPEPDPPPPKLEPILPITASASSISKKTSLSKRKRSKSKSKKKPKLVLEPVDITLPPPPSRRHCQFCGLDCKSPADLATHEMIHTGERPYGCTFCDLRFVRKYNTMLHVIRMHCRTNRLACQKSKSYSCPFCSSSPEGNLFRSKEAMYRHISSNHETLFKPQS